MKLLLVDAEQKSADSFFSLVKRNGFITDVASNGEKGLEMACTGIYDIVILEWTLPRKDGMTILKEFRRLGHDTPVLFLTAKSSPENRAEGLNAGADDYVSKPFYSIELLARLQALGRRRNKKIIDNVLTTGEITFNPLRGQVLKGKERIQLTVKESQLLELLMLNNGQVVTKEQIMHKIWGYYSESSFTAVNLYIHYLRKKLDLPNLKTVWGVGYYLQKNEDMALTAN